jgi:hypothetical protein
LNKFLTALATWRGFIVYRLAPIIGKPGKMDKVPIDPVTGYNSDAQDTRTWMLPEVALAAAAEWAPVYKDGTGVGISIYQGSQLFCCDIDGCIDAAGNLSEIAQQIIARFPGAVVEISQSKTGLHIFGTYRGVLPPHAKKNTPWHIELYTEKRFIALTGNFLHEGDIFTDCTDALTAFAAEYFPFKGGAYAGDWTDYPAEGWDFLTDDDALLAWAVNFRDSKTAFGAKAPIGLLIAGHPDLGKWFPPNDPTGQSYDASSADQSLCNFFAWGTGNNCERVERLMRRTGLARPKWDNREDYLRSTIAKACAEPKRWPTRRDVPPTIAPVPMGADNHQAHGQGVPVLPTQGQDPQGVVIPEPPVLDGKAPDAPPRGSVFFTIDQQKHFAGCVYVEDVHMIMLPDGILLDQKRFDLREPFAGREFQVTLDGSSPSKSAWEAFTAGVTEFPKVRGQYFEPREIPGAIIVREGHRFVNSWRPIEIESKPGDVQWFLDHLARILPAANDAYILAQFLKFCVQHKGEKAAWFPFIQGVEGNGKSFINETMQYCLGERYTHKPRPNELAGRFNSAFYGKLLIAIDDIQLADARHIWETLKPMVDGKRLEIEYKGVDKVTREVCFNIIATSNHKDGIPVTANDRRVAPFFCAQQVETDLARDGLTEAYFSNLWGIAANGGWANVLHYLSTDPIDPKYNPAADALRAPRTSSTFDAKAVGLGIVEQEILEAVAVEAHGFAGGWISSIAVDRMLKAIGKDKMISLNKRAAILGTLGYIPHPGLTDGRVSSPLTDGTKPRLYIKPDHVTAALTDKVLIKQLFETAQAIKV